MSFVLDSKDVGIEGADISFQQKEVKVTINIQDIIGCQSLNIKATTPVASQTKISKSDASHVIHYINKKKGYTWTVEKIFLCGNVGTSQDLVSAIQRKLAEETDRPKKLLVLVNPIGGKQNAKSVLKKEVAPLLQLAGITTDVLISERPKHMVEIISSYDLSQVDGIVVMGGDGSVLEVMNYLITKTQVDAGVNYDDPMSVFATVQKPVSVIPTGTGNGIAFNLHGVYDTLTAVLHLIKGKTRKRNCLTVHSGGKFVSYSGIVLAYGLFGDMMYYTDKQRWLKKLRYLVVPVWLMLVKSRRFFKSKLTYYTKVSQKDDSTESSENMKETVIDGSLLNIMCFPGNCITEQGGVDFSVGTTMTSDQSMFSLLCFKRIGRLRLVGEFVKIFKRDPTALCHEEIDQYKVLGFKVKIIKDEEEQLSEAENAQLKILNSILDIDGEIFEITDEEFEVAYKYDVCTFYSSLEAVTHN